MGIKKKATPVYVYPIQIKYHAFLSLLVKGDLWAILFNLNITACHFIVVICGKIIKAI